MATLTQPPRALQAQTTTPTHDAPSIYDPPLALHRQPPSNFAVMDQHTINDDNNDSEMEGAEDLAGARVSLLPPDHHPDFAPVAVHHVIHSTTSSTESAILS